MSKIRIRIDTYFDVKTPADAYRRLFKGDLGAWESTDDWDQAGAPLTSAAIERARQEIHEERELTVKVFRDAEDWANPRKNEDNLGTMYCTHPNYLLGDKGAVAPEAAWGEIVCQLPLYLYDHGGLTMSTGAFSCQWDSGQVGWIYLTKAAAEEAQVSPEEYELLLKSEVHIYDLYLQGEVWGCTLGADEGESYGGYYGTTLEETGLLDAVPERYHENLKKAWENRA